MSTHEINEWDISDPPDPTFWQNAWFWFVVGGYLSIVAGGISIIIRDIVRASLL